MRKILDQGNDHLEIKNKNLSKETFSSVSEYLNSSILGY